MPVLHKIKKARRRRDRYETDPKLAQAAVELLPYGLAPRNVMDAGAGTGVWGQAAKRRWGAAYVTGAELGTEPTPPCFDLYRYGDFLTMPFYEQYELVVSNPPFDLAEKFVERAYDILAPCGYLLMLLPISFLGSQGRGRGLWQRWPARHVHVLVERPSFFWYYDADGNIHSTGETDAMEYAIYIWRKDTLSAHSTPSLHWLDWSRSAENALTETRKAA